MIIIHAALMLTGFFSAAAGIGTAMFMRDKRWWLRVHRRLGSAAVMCVLIGFGTALIMVSLKANRHFGVPHAWLGLAVILSVLCTYVLGVTQLKRKTARMRSLHRWSGRITFVLIFFNVLSGLTLTGILPV